MENEQYLPMKQWAKDEQPREKLLHKGASALAVNELMALILRSGKRGESALDLARRILADCDNNLNNLAKIQVSELVRKYNGIGMAKAAGIVAAVELGRRRLSDAAIVMPVVSSSIAAYNYIAPIIGDLDHEEFWIIYLNRANRIQGSERLSSGGMAGTVIDVRMLFRKALEMKASALIVAHNHPSGTLYPSEQDKVITAKIKEAGKLLDVALHDHIIVAGNTYYSFVDEGKMEFSKS